MAVLKGISSVVKGAVFELKADETSLGRDALNNIQIADPSVSSFHCVIIKDGDKFSVRDLGSTNGTRVNGQTVTMRRIAPGNLVQFGAVELMFEGEGVAIDDVNPPLSPPKVEVAARGERKRTEVSDAGFKINTAYKERAVMIALIAGGLLALLGVVVLFIILF